MFLPASLFRSPHNIIWTSNIATRDRFLPYSVLDGLVDYASGTPITIFIFQNPLPGDISFYKCIIFIVTDTFFSNVSASVSLEHSSFDFCFVVLWFFLYRLLLLSWWQGGFLELLVMKTWYQICPLDGSRRFTKRAKKKKSKTPFLHSKITTECCDYYDQRIWLWKNHAV